MTNEDFETFLAAYIECALWSTTDPESEEPLDANYGPDDLAPETLDEMRRDCASFVFEERGRLAKLDPEQCGHDFWLTRNGHGAGFWDRGLGAVGERLSRACKPYGSVDLYVGDDGMIHC